MNQNEPTDTDGKENRKKAMDAANLKGGPDADHSITDPGSMPITAPPPANEENQMEVHHHPQLKHNPNHFLFIGLMATRAIKSNAMH